MVFKKKFIHYLLFFLLLLDIAYSFCQYYHQPLDGDMAPIVVPSQWYQQVLEDPLGYSALIEGETYAATNRYAVHACMSLYFWYVPNFLQNFIHPVESVYAAAALLKIMVHLALLGLLAIYVTEFISWSHNYESQPKQQRNTFLLAAVLLAALFQTTQFNLYMGVVFGAPTFTFSYSFSFALLLLFFLPFYKAALKNKWLSKTNLQQHRLTIFTKKSRFLNISQQILWGFLLLFLVLSNPMIPPVLLIICPLGLLYLWWKEVKAFEKFSPLVAIRTIPKSFLFFFILAILLSLYSHYLGTFNLENLNNNTMPLTQRYQLLLIGIGKQLSSKLGFPLLVSWILVNTLILYFYKNNPVIKKWLKWLGAIFIFIVIFTLLLPLGGYREYRPHIIRSDSFLPITLCLLYIFAVSSMLLLKYLKGRIHSAYLLGVTIIILFFTISDEPRWESENCEKTALYTMYHSEEEVLELSADCHIMAWKVFKQKKQSAVNAKLLRRWNILKAGQLYKQVKK